MKILLNQVWQCYYFFRFNKAFKRIILFLIAFPTIFSCEAEGPAGPPIISTNATNELYIPPLIDTDVHGNNITLSMQQGTHEFFPGVDSQTFGYNGTFLGPTIRTYRNRDVSLTTVNNIDSPTTIHKHGFHVPGSVDGGPQQKIHIGESRTDILEIRQQASTNWYHPHLMGKTAEHVFKGLAGLFLIEDENSLGLGLPNTYGVDDIPLIIQDRYFLNNEMVYEEGNTGEDGYFGNTIIVNGTVSPYKEVTAGWVRFRVLNASNARFYNLYFSDNRQFHVIANDGGFLDNPVQLNEFEVWPGERYEIMVDFSDSSDTVLVANSANNNNQEFNIIEFRPNNNLPTEGSLPNQLNNINRYQISDVIQSRNFELNMEGAQGGMMGINGVAMDMSVINEEITLGNLERWTITSDEGEHPFHLHGTSFLILSMDGGAVPAYESGWKDVVKVNEEAEVLLRFKHPADENAPYMYHCHILEHEDMGMMGQFTVK